MKKIVKTITIVVIALLCLTSCVKKNVNYAVITGKVTNQVTDSLVIYWVETDTTIKPIKPNLRIEKIDINPDGTFRDTIKDIKYTPNGQTFYDGVDNTKGGFIYLQNGYELHMELDVEKWYETLTYTGKNAVESKYLRKHKEFMNNAFNKYGDMFSKGEEYFEEKLTAISNELIVILDKYKGKIDPVLYAQEKKKFTTQLNEEYRERFKMVAVGDTYKGKPSPKFENYETVDDKVKSLEDFKGKFVYIDVWATWCKPCIEEIDDLQKLEKEYHGKNIAFVSISVDTEKAKKAWKKMIEDREMGGVQLRADKELSSKFIVDYKITSIPRFIFIDPNGDVISSNAPRPSQYEEIKGLFDSALQQ